MKWKMFEDAKYLRKGVADCCLDQGHAHTKRLERRDGAMGFLRCCDSGSPELVAFIGLRGQCLNRQPKAAVSVRGVWSNTGVVLGKAIYAQHSREAFSA
jgi:hypothetical protein